jgi:hypothetical protein
MRSSAPVVINFLSIVISMGWTTATFTVSGWSGKRERCPCDLQQQQQEQGH